MPMKKKPSLKFKRVTIKNPKGYQVVDPSIGIGRRRTNGKTVLQVPFEKKLKKKKK